MDTVSDDKKKPPKQTGQAPSAEDVSLRPWTDADDLSAWDVVADSDSDGPMGVLVQVKLGPQLAPVVVRAARRAGLDVTAFVQEAVEDLARSLAERESAAPRATVAR
jgi:hypothetical protein